MLACFPESENLVSHSKNITAQREMKLRDELFLTAKLNQIWGNTGKINI